MNPYRDYVDSDVVSSSPQLGYSDIAAKLLQDHFLLTALEFHTELVESGRELPQLREFFSNPGNFEQHVSRGLDNATTIPRTASLATLDSLDFARLSEDGGAGIGGTGGPGTGSSGAGAGNEIAVLEFELRKARDTINALRANLTRATEYEMNTSEKRDHRLIYLDQIKPHEQRALNFLINEYLLMQDCKLTSITFSDENPNQDFDSWDDVGLNFPRPMSLISMYRGERIESQKSNHTTHTQTEFTERESIGCQTDIEKEDPETFCPKCHMEIKSNSCVKWTEEVSEIAALKQQILALEMEKLNFQRLYDTALASLNSLSSPSSELPNSEITIYHMQQPTKPPDELTLVNTHDLSKYRDNTQPITHIADDNYYGSNSSTNSGTPDQFEMIGSETTGGRAGSNTSSFEPATYMSESSYNGAAADAVSTGTGAEDTAKHDTPKIQKQAWMNGLSPEYASALLSWCGLSNQPDVPGSSPGCDLLAELMTVSQPSLDTLLHTIGVSLPRIVSQMSVSRRGEALPLAIVSTHLAVNSSSSAESNRNGQALTRKLLHLLLGLYKKPSEDEMKTIITAIALLLKWGGTNEDSSIALAALCCVAELLGGETSPGGSSSAGPARSLLAANVCLAASRLVPLELLSSLVFSITQSMCESVDAEIRLFGLKCAVLACPTVAADKYQQFENLLFSLCDDCNEQVSSGSVSIFLPVLARSALYLGKLQESLCLRILVRISKSSFKSGSDKSHSAPFNLRILSTILPIILVHVTNVDILKKHSDGSQITSKLPTDNIILDPNHIAKERGMNIHTLVCAFHNILESQPELSWSEKDWLNDMFINKLVRHIIDDQSCEDEMHIISYIELFESIRRLFSVHIYKSTLEKNVALLKRDMANFGSYSVGAMVLVSIYIATVLPSTSDENGIEDFIKSWCECFAISGQNVSGVLTPVKWLAFENSELTDCIIKTLAGVLNHSNEHVRLFAAMLVAGMINPEKVTDREKLSKLCSKLEPSVIALLEDTSSQVLLSAYPALGYLLCVNGGSRASWGAMVAAAEKAVISSSSEGGQNVSFVVQILTEVMLHADDDAVYEKVLPILCMVCNSPATDRILNKIGTNALLGSLLPAMQLATQTKNIGDQFNKDTLLPALRKLQSFDAQNGNDHKSSLDALIYRQSSQHHLSPAQTTFAAPVTTPQQHGNTAHLAETVGRRMTQMLQSTKPTMNLHNIFKKKT